MLTLSDMIDLRPYVRLHTIQLLRNILQRWWKVELSFTDATGYVLEHAQGRLAPSNNEFCHRCLNTREGFHRCNEVLRTVRDRAQGQVQGLLFERCHLGFDLHACPITLDGEFAGLLFVCGSLPAPPNSDALEQLEHKAQKLLLGQAQRWEDAASRIPLIAEGDIARLGDLMKLGAAEIAAFHLEHKQRDHEVMVLRQKLGERYHFDSIVGASRPMQEVFRLLEKIIDSESAILIQGESGTGKELVARAIHYNGPRAKKPFVAQNCSAFNDDLLESALFGHIKGSFTGAIKDQKGLFEVADGGTFFLDEIGDMSPALQMKLLRVLQEGTFTPVGGTKQQQADVRVIAATHKDLNLAVKRGEFREDLFYRVNVIKVQLPALRERIEDLDLLIDHFLRKHFRHRPLSERIKPPRLAPAALAILRRYSWPGNIRELENEIERLLVLSGDLEELPQELLSLRLREQAGTARESSAPLAHPLPLGTLKASIEIIERELIAQGLIRTHWNKSVLAKELGISRSNLIAKVEHYGLEKKGRP